MWKLYDMGYTNFDLNMVIIEEAIAEGCTEFKDMSTIIEKLDLIY